MLVPAHGSWESFKIPKAQGKGQREKLPMTPWAVTTLFQVGPRYKAGLKQRC